VVWTSAAVELSGDDACNMALARVVAETSVQVAHYGIGQHGGLEQPKTRVSRPYERTWWKRIESWETKFKTNAVQIAIL